MVLRSLTGKSTSTCAETSHEKNIEAELQVSPGFIDTTDSKMSLNDTFEAFDI